METVSDLHSKYQKLAAEYSKMRAQMTVLKAAVLEERSQAGQLREEARHTEQRMRKAEQEMDSLTFRNQQLAKRVAVLQAELDAMQSRPKKGKGKGASDAGYTSESSNHVLDEEFHNKIEENARLLSLMQEEEAAHQQQLKVLTDKLHNLEVQLQQRQQLTSQSQHSFTVELERLEREKAELMKSLAARDAANEELSSLQNQYCQLQKELGSQLNAANAIIRHHLPFVDTKREDLNELNVPRYDHKHELYLLHIITQTGNHVKELVSALSDCHTYTEQRLHALCDWLSPVNTMFSGHLKENARYLRALEQGYEQFQGGLVPGESMVALESLSLLQCVCVPLAAYTSYCTKLASSQALSLEEESSALSATDKLCAANNDVHCHFAAVSVQFSKLNTYVKLLASQSKRSSRNPPSSQTRLVIELTSALAALHEALKDLLRSWTRKTEVESQLPTSSERLRTTNICLVNALTAVVASLGKLSGLLCESCSELGRSLLSSVRIHPVVASLKRRAVAYMHAIRRQEEAPTVAYEEALKEREELRTCRSALQAAQQQLQSVQQRAVRLDQEREHWKLEFQLLQLRHCKKVEVLEDQLAAAAGIASNAARPRSGSETLPGANITSLLGTLESPLPVLCAEVEAREQEVKKYFAGKMNELVERLQEAETQAALFSFECESMQQRLELCVAGKQQADSSLGDAQDCVVRLQEELGTTTKNYELQLSIMSEHLANMNDRLSAQKDEIDQLKYQLNAKPGRKGKLK